MDELDVRAGPALGECHPERVEDEIGAHVIGELPAHDRAAVDVDHEREEDDAFPAPQVSEIRTPALRPRTAASRAVVASAAAASTSPTAASTRRTATSTPPRRTRARTKPRPNRRPQATVKAKTVRIRSAATTSRAKIAPASNTSSASNTPSQRTALNSPDLATQACRGDGASVPGRRPIENGEEGSVLIVWPPRSVSGRATLWPPFGGNRRPFEQRTSGSFSLPLEKHMRQPALSAGVI